MTSTTKANFTTNTASRPPVGDTCVLKEQMEFEQNSWVKILQSIIPHNTIPAQDLSRPGLMVRM